MKVSKVRVKIARSKNSTSYSIIKDVYNENGKRTTKVVEALGNEEEILEKYPGVDPYVWAKQYAKELAQQEKKKNTKIIVKLDKSKQLPKGKQQSYHLGYLFLEDIFYDLKLDQICKKIQKSSKETFDLTQLFSHMIYSRILSPGSQRHTYKQAKKYIESPKYHLYDEYRALDLLAKHSEFIQKSLYENRKNIVPSASSIFYYDCTNYYFEIEEAEGLKQYGYSKEHRPNPIVQMGLFVDQYGFPLGFSLTPGNQNEQTTLKPLEKRILNDFKLSQLVVCTDAGLSSTANRKFNSQSNKAFITTQSIKKLKKHLKKWALSPTGWQLKNNEIRYDLNDLNPEEYYNDVFYKDRWINENGLEQHLIVTFSFKYQHYQRQIRRRQIERATKKLEHPSKIKKKNFSDPSRFITETHFTPNGEISQNVNYTLNFEQIESEEIYDGFYGVCTDLEDDVQSIVQVNHCCWQIEDCFRAMKTNFKARPIFLQRENRIEAHFLTCFTALLLFKLLDYRLGGRFTREEILHTLREMNGVRMQPEGYIPTFTRTGLTDLLHENFSFQLDTEIIETKRLKNILKQIKKHRCTKN